MDRKALIEKLESLSQKQKFVIFCLTILLLALAYWYFFFLPEQNTLKTLEQEIASLDQTLPILSKKLRRLPALKEEYATRQHELTFAKSLLPKSNSDIENLLSEIEALGNDQGVEFILFAPGKENLQDFYASTSVNLNINGQFHNLMLFFSRLSRINRLVTLESLNLKPLKHDQNETSLTASSVIYLYRALTEAELAAQQKKK